MLYAMPSKAIDDQAIISFNVKEYPSYLPQHGKAPLQGVTILACNTKTDIKISWGENNQSYNLPYGEVASETEGEYFISKYYLASPPVNNQVENAILGQLRPDNFSFNEKGSRQNPRDKFSKDIEVTYSVLPAVSVGEIKTDFTYIDETTPESCKQQGVKLVPINIKCDDFPRLNGRYGASGVGFLESSSPNDKIFVPKFGDGSARPLNCSATILDDIVLKHNITFSNGEKTVDMARLYSDKQAMQFVCVKREPGDIPKGCRTPDGIYATKK
jgi:hypothetical protein